MIALGAVNIRLIRDPSIAVKAFGPIFSSKTQPPPKAPTLPAKETNEGKPSASRTPLDFYVRLNQDEVPQTDAKAAEQQTDPACSPNMSDQKEDAKRNRTSRAAEVDTQQPQTSIPEAESKTKTYTVQVGAFSQPAIAQEWAQKWKARGYDPMLRPVARPKTGVIYRLYLGKFTSEKKADDLVKHLKSKEGINALRLLVRE
jgi:cell division septation protein DedD